MDLDEIIDYIKGMDEEYRRNLNIPKFILMIIARITELSKEEQNKICLYLFNSKI